MSAAIRPTGPPGEIIARFLEEHAFEMVLSPAILAEIQRSLRYPRVRKSLTMSAKDLERWVEDIALIADLVEDRPMPNIVLDDPDDDKYVAAALVGRADYVVSGDMHLLVLRAHEGVRIVTPRDFLRLLVNDPPPPDA